MFRIDLNQVKRAKNAYFQVYFVILCINCLVCVFSVYEGIILYMCVIIYKKDSVKSTINI